MNNSQEEELIALLARCAIRDQQALKQLYDATAPFLNGVAYRILHSQELSNEVLQDAFVQIWQNAAEYRIDKAKPLTWITSIVRYRALDKLKGEHRHQHGHDSDEQQLEQLHSEASPEQDYALQQTRDQIGFCLNKMSDNIKKSIELAYLQGYSREEIAQHFDTKVNTVKSWLRRGSERLKQCLNSSQKTLA